jgi:hypothetical protein
VTSEMVPAGFEPLFRTSPFLEALGPVYCRRDEGRLVLGAADIQRIGRRLAFVNVYLAVGSTRIVRASGVDVRGDGDARGGSTI